MPDIIVTRPGRKGKHGGLIETNNQVLVIEAGSGKSRWEPGYNA